MEIIKSIRKLKNNQYTLTTESGKKISVSEDTLVRHRLLKGEEITDESLEKIRKEAEMDIYWIPPECLEHIHIRMNRNDGILILNF